MKYFTTFYEKDDICEELKADIRKTLKKFIHLSLLRFRSKFKEKDFKKIYKITIGFDDEGNLSTLHIMCKE